MVWIIVLHSVLHKLRNRSLAVAHPFMGRLEGVKVHSILSKELLISKVNENNG
jgi:hypothetical protein